MPSIASCMEQPCLVILCTLAFDVRHHHVQLVAAAARQRRRGAMPLRAAAAVDTIVTETRHTDDNKTKRRC